MSTRMSFEKIAILMKEGFDHIDQRFDSVEQRLTNLERTQEAILLRLDQCAYRFELQALEQRVGKLETGARG